MVGGRRAVGGSDDGNAIVDRRYISSDVDGKYRQCETKPAHGRDNTWAFNTGELVSIPYKLPGERLALLVPKHFRLNGNVFLLVVVAKNQVAEYVQVVFLPGQQVMPGQE